ncbi:hypothetical protein [Lactiplantibacillus garii]|uniref:hypothetical protein n=1 Tax=Lactiplantibacillus garii TaxID=2306423 RepID=UPI001315352A|nr:hypothetical protein [Lactiplantibacillus garii]
MKQQMHLGSFAWVLPVSVTVTAVLGLTVLGLGICWWRIFKLTVRRFNTEERRRD